MRFFLLLVAFGGYFFAHGQDASTREWNEYYRLGWHDFMGQPTEHSIGDAGTFVRIIAKPFQVGGEIHYDVSALFVKDKSWVRDKADHLLQHEQLHFDIAEVYARKIRKKVSELRRRKERDLKVFNQAIRDLLEESNKADRDYDMQTLHGALMKKQQVWQRKVQEDLRALEKYKKQKRIISAG